MVTKEVTADQRRVLAETPPPSLILGSFVPLRSFGPITGLG